MIPAKIHQNYGLNDSDVLAMYKYMVLARKIDERMWLLNRSGKIPFVISCQGQEAAQVGAAFALKKEVDVILPYYRDVGVVLVFGLTAKDLMLAAFAKAEDPASGGRQMPGHFSSKKHRIVSGSSPVTTQVPHAVGIALAAKLKEEELVSFTTFGEGSSNQGDFHEGANFAGVHKLPVIFMVENNQYAISVPVKKQIPVDSVAVRAAGYGMPGISVDGNNPFEVYHAVHEARERGIRGEGPTLIEAVTYRLVPHSSDDDDRSYRSREEVEEAKQRDPILLLRQYLFDSGLMDEKADQELQDHLLLEVNEATEYAEKADYPTVDTIMNHVYEGQGGE